MSVDLRFRVDGDEPRPSDPADFFLTELPAAFDRNADGLQSALAWLDLAPLTIDVGDDAWNLSVNETVEVRRGPAAHGAAVRLTPEQLADLAADQTTFMGFFTHGTLDQTAGRLEDLLDWWLVLRSALDGRPIHTADELSFTDADGRPLDLARSFRSGDDPTEMQHFLEEAGFLHLEGLFNEGEMDAISRDMDRLAPDYSPDDGRSWWATTADGTQRLVRMQGFDTCSDATRKLLDDDRFLAIGALPGDDHCFADYAQALVKPVGVVEGISDVPWHKDCSLGRHSYDCCSMTVGVSVTGADATLRPASRGGWFPPCSGVAHVHGEGHRIAGDRPPHRHW